ncbi:MAG: BMC domain-containing protein [Ruminococcaceae bacterium]|nr:BMC domain-containing protein [Oscillospiraceae bacterium]
MQKTKALGMIEVRGRLGCIEALDAALKAANVSLLTMVKVGGGLTAVFIEGDVGAVKAAVNAGGAAAKEVSDVVSVHVIPRPDPNVRVLLKGTFLQNISTTDISVPSKTASVKKSTPAKKAKTDYHTAKDLNAMRVVELRSLARSFEDFPMTREQIKFAKKDELVKALKKCQNGGRN